MHAQPVRQHITQGLLAWVLGLWLALAPFSVVQAQGVELAELQTSRADGALNLDFVARLNLPRPVEDALQRGVPLYFVAEAQLLRNRWYWRDERVAKVSRSWRLAYRPLSREWRVSLGGLNQTFPTQAEALATVSRSGGWKLADLSQLDEKGYYVEFSYRLDTSQLPGPMQFGLGGQGDWAVGVSRTLRVDL
jgi:predicted outer membrane lipoprotein